MVEAPLKTEDKSDSSQLVRLTAADGHIFSAYVAKPNSPPKAAIVVCQDAYGVGDYIKSVCRHYAGLGYVAIAPFFYDRQQRDALFDHSLNGRQAAGGLRKGLSWEQVVTDAEAAMAAVADAGKIGVLGFCVGGSMAWRCANRLPFHAASCYYGKDIVDWLDEPPHCPTELHFGEQDHLIPIADIETVRVRCSGMDFFTYEAGHGFDGVGKGYSESASLTARQRTLAFFDRHLAS